MAKAKKDAEVYEVPALAITPEKPQSITGNYEAVESVLEKWASRVSKMSLSEDSLDEVQVIKKAAVSTRRQLDAKVDEAKKRLFNDPKAIFEARVKNLYTLIAKVEGKANEVLDKLEQERIAGINEALDYYKEKFQEQYRLEETYLSRIEYRKSYYNKGTDEKLRKDDLEGQFTQLKKEQSAYEANIRLIEASCRDEPRLNTARYIQDLVSVDVATIVEDIAAEKLRLKELDKQPAQTAQTIQTSTAGTADAEFEIVDNGQGACDTGKLVLGVPSGINFQSDFPGRNTTRAISITYPCDLGDALKELFTGLRPYGIKIRELKTEEVAF